MIYIIKWGIIDQNSIPERSTFTDVVYAVDVSNAIEQLKQKLYIQEYPRVDGELFKNADTMNKEFKSKFPGFVVLDCSLVNLDDDHHYLN